MDRLETGDASGTSPRSVTARDKINTPLIPAIYAISHALLFTDAFTVTIDDHYCLPNSAGITPTSVRFRGTRPSYPTMSLDRPETGKTEIVTESSEMTVVNPHQYQ